MGQIEQIEELLHLSGGFSQPSFFRGQLIFIVVLPQPICLQRVFICMGKLTVSIKKIAKGKTNINALALISDIKNNKKNENIIGIG